VPFEQPGGGDGGFSEPVQLGPASVPGQAQRGGTGLDRPHAAPVVAERVVRGVLGGQGTDAPAAEHVGREQPAGDPGGVPRGHDTGGQQVAVVGVDRADLPRVRSQGHGVAVPVGHPVRGVEAAAQRGRPPYHAGREGPVAGCREGERTVSQGGVVVPLQFARGDRVVDHGAVFVDDRGVRVLPPLVLHAGARPGVVLQEPVAVEVGVPLQPLDHASGGRQQVAYRLPVAGPGQVLPEEDEEVRTGGVVPVVPAERVETQSGQWAGPRLVQQLARFLVAPVVDGPPDVRGVQAQAVAQHRRTGKQRLPGHGERVPAEDLLVHRQAGDRRGGPGRLAQRQGGQIGDTHPVFHQTRLVICR
jgi:hypothetical protein